MVCFGLAIASTRRFPRWTGVVLLIAAATLLGQFAVFRGALPFPQFLAFIALGIAALVRPPAPASPAPGLISPHLALGAFRIDNLGVSGDSAFAPHRAVGFAMAGVALLILILALMARPGVRALIGSALLFLLAVLVQSLLASLADNTVWFGGLHALDGLAILGIAAFLYLAARRQHS